MKTRILGKRYELSVVSVPARRMRELNRRYRGKDSATDILSFPYGTRSGEIIFHLPTVRARAKTYALGPADYLAFLFIHGCLHLKGEKHGRIMEKLEDRWCRVFHIPLPKR